MRTIATVLCAALLACAGSTDARPRVTLISTHTLEDSGLLDSLAADFQRAHPELQLRVIVAGSGEALALGRRGDGDVLLTHSPDAEAAFVRAGSGRARRELMRNDFLLLGPPGDPARAGRAADAAAAFDRVRVQAHPFVSRGDESGTHLMERKIWARTGRAPAWPGYIEAGVGMGDALRIASERRAYILADRATWSVLQPQLQLAVVHEGDPQLRNVYSVVTLDNPAHRSGATVLAEWLVSAEAKRRIAQFGGGKLFVLIEG